MKIVPLSQSKFALVDDADYDAVMAAGPWYALQSLHTFYAVRSEDALYMHRFILGLHAFEGIMGEHRNGNGLDNQSHNLRTATNSQNQRNKGKVTAYAGHAPSSHYKGVRWRSNRSVWESSLRIDGKYKYLGAFAVETDAAIAYNIAAYLAYGGFAVLNAVTKVVAQMGS